MRFFTYLTFVFLGSALLLFCDVGNDKIQRDDRNSMIFYTSDNPFPDEVESDDSPNYNNTDYEYQHIPVYSGHYRNDYGITGTDANGKPVSGNIEFRDRSGSGVVADANGNKIKLNVQLKGNGSLVGVDEKGNKYFLNHQ